MTLEITKVLNGYKMLIIDDSDPIGDPQENVYQFRPVSDDREAELLALKEMILDLNDIIGVNYDGSSEYNLDIDINSKGDAA